jgi:hypothetical protein
MKNIFWFAIISSSVLVSCYQEDEIKLKTEYGRFGLVITNSASWQSRNVKIFESEYNADFDYRNITYYAGGDYEIKGVKHKYVDLNNFCDRIDSLIPIGNVFYNGLISVDANYKIMIVGEILKRNTIDTLILDDIKISKDECFVKHIEMTIN